MRLIDNNRVISFGQCPDFIQYKRKFLQSGNNDIRAAGECLCQLSRIFVDFLDNTGFMLKLINCILQLLIKNDAVSDYDHRIKYSFIVFVV